MANAARDAKAANDHPSEDENEQRHNGAGVGDDLHASYQAAFLKRNDMSDNPTSIANRSQGQVSTTKEEHKQFSVFKELKKDIDADAEAEKKAAAAKEVVDAANEFREALAKKKSTTKAGSANYVHATLSENHPSCRSNVHMAWQRPTNFFSALAVDEDNEPPHESVDGKNDVDLLAANNGAGRQTTFADLPKDVLGHEIRNEMVTIAREQEDDIFCESDVNLLDTYFECLRTHENLNEEQIGRLKAGLQSVGWTTWNLVCIYVRPRFNGVDSLDGTNLSVRLKCILTLPYDGRNDY
eukprot:SAG22_NODE_1317_length_4765_cov_2.131590_4_plen_297_part_00